MTHTKFTDHKTKLIDIAFFKPLGSLEFMIEMSRRRFCEGEELTPEQIHCYYEAKHDFLEYLYINAPKNNKDKLKRKLDVAYNQTFETDPSKDIPF
jgi:hypothetical protein